jgi:hypothetical protein
MLYKKPSLVRKNVKLKTEVTVESYGNEEWLYYGITCPFNVPVSEQRTGRRTEDATDEAGAACAMRGQVFRSTYRYYQLSSFWIFIILDTTV